MVFSTKNSQEGSVTVTAALVSQFPCMLRFLALSPNFPIQSRSNCHTSQCSANSWIRYMYQALLDKYGRYDSNRNSSPNERPNLIDQKISITHDEWHVNILIFRKHTLATTYHTRSVCYFTTLHSHCLLGLSPTSTFSQLEFLPDGVSPNWRFSHLEFLALGDSLTWSFPHLEFLALGDSATWSFFRSEFLVVSCTWSFSRF